MKRIEFKLSMPGVGSWNGQWNGSEKNYFLYRNISDKEAEKLNMPNRWSHSWDDGWRASVSARAMEKGERRQKSDGFCGYDWMVDNILRWGDTKCRCEWTPSPDFDEEGEWETCINCGTTRKIEA